MDSYLGAVFCFGFNFPPYGWAQCNGQVFPISGNEALFSLIGTTYGGDGVTTFALPNIQGRVPIGTGQGPGLANYVLGQIGGVESVTLAVNNLPAHTHPGTATIPVSSAAGDSNDPSGRYFARSSSAVGNTYSGTSGVVMAGPLTGTSGTAGTGSPVPISLMNPYQTLNYCISIYGIFPSRN